MKEIVWVFGTSASGKETFIKHVLKDAVLREKLGWAEKVVWSSKYSLEYIGQFENDPITNNRESIIKEVESLLEAADVVLIKWQSVDTTANLPELLKQRTPEVKQKIIELVAPQVELVERLSRKRWWHDYGHEKQFVEDELTEVNNVITRLHGDFELVRVSSGESDNYRTKT